MRVITPSRAGDLSIGKLSRLSGVTIETIRYYERVKMLPEPPRTVSGRRSYDTTHLRILSFIRRSRELGFTIAEIRTLIRLGGPEKSVVSAGSRSCYASSCKC
jgi:MerR family mercuric resistance operon transcriptional regulator